MVSRLTALSHAAGALFLLALLSQTQPVHAANIYVTSSGNVAADSALETILESFGHDVTIGASYLDFDGTQSLAGIETVYLQTNYNWSQGLLDMPDAGQTVLRNFVLAGGGLVTNEWIIWKTVSHDSFNILQSVFPVMPSVAFNSATSTTFSLSTANPILNAGLPNSFVVPLESISGTETIFTTLQPGAVAYYNSSNSGVAGLVGGTFGAGSVLQFSTVNGQGQVADPNFARLLSNSMEFVAGNAVAAAPEPGTLALIGIGLLGLIARRMWD